MINLSLLIIDVHCIKLYVFSAMTAKFQTFLQLLEMVVRPGCCILTIIDCQIMCYTNKLQVKTK